MSARKNSIKVKQKKMNNTFLIILLLKYPLNEIKIRTLLVIHFNSWVLSKFSNCPNFQA